MPDEFVDGPPPKSRTAAGSEFVDGPPPSGVAAVAPASRRWQDRLAAFTLPNGSQTVQRPDGAVYIKESNDPRFKGQEGWHVLDQKTGVWAPATPEDASAYGALNRKLGPEAWKSTLRNVWEGLKRPGEAVTGLTADLAHAVGLQGDKSYLNTINELEGRERYRQAVKNASGGGLMQFTGEMIPAVAATLMAPAAAPTAFASETAMAPTVAPFLQRAAANTLTSAGTAYALTPGNNSERMKSAMVASAIAPVAQGAGELVPVVGRGLKALKAKVSMPEPSQPVPTKYQEIRDLFDQYGVTPRPGDVTGSPAMRRTEDALLRQSPEMQALVTQQNEQAKAAAKSMADNLHQEMIKQGFNSLDQVQAVAKQGGKRGTAAQNLLAAVENSGDDWKLVLQTSGNMNLFKGKLAADAAYNKFEQKAAAYGDVPLVGTSRALEEAKRELAKSALPDKATRSIVDELSTNLNRQAAQGSEGAVAQAAGAGGVTSAPLPPQSTVDTTFAGLRQLRSSIGNRLSDYYTGKNAIIGKEGAGLLERIKGAIEQDMEDFAKANGPELATAWRDADRIYKTQVAPYKDRALAQALADSSPEKAARFFLSKGDPFTKGRIFRALDPKGQAAVKDGLLQEAMDAGTKAERGADGITFSPAQFAGWLERNSDAVDTAFKGSDKWALDGLQKVMRHVDRSGSVGANPMTGQVLEEALKGAHSMTAIGAASKGFNWLEKRNLLRLYTTPEGRRLLLQASELDPGSKAMDSLVGRITQRMPAITGAAAPSIANAYQFDQPQQ